MWWRNPAFSYSLDPPCDAPSAPSHLRVLFDKDLLEWVGCATASCRRDKDTSCERVQQHVMSDGGGGAGSVGGDDGGSSDGTGSHHISAQTRSCDGCGSDAQSGPVAECDDAEAQQVWFNVALKRALDVPQSQMHESSHTDCVGPRATISDQDDVPLAHCDDSDDAGATAAGATACGVGEENDAVAHAPESIRDRVLPSTSDREITSAYEARTVLLEASCVVGMHPDQATEPIVDFALARGLPFAVVRWLFIAQCELERLVAPIALSRF